MKSLSWQIASIVEFLGRIAFNSLVNWLRALSPDSPVPGFSLPDSPYWLCPDAIFMRLRRIRMGLKNLWVRKWGPLPRVPDSSDSAIF